MRTAVMSSPAMLEWLERATEAIARSRERHPAPVLVVGEPGTGKTFLTHWLHANGARRDRPLHVVPDALSARTFADALAIADGATLLLDDFGRLGRATVARLADAIVASPFDVQLLCTDRRRDDEPTSPLSATPGSIELEVPPLRARAGDVIALAEMFFLREGLSPRPEILDVLARHSWPGNVRELEDVVVRIARSDPGERLAVARSALARGQVRVAP